ncbi:MAG: hypothetical protein JNJ49_08535 [Bdellovibrionaceae bacterium]|nr:hypothetical protein [Pseudobdellovibrionaceae bacterium]
MNQGPKKFKSKEDIKAFLERVSGKMEIERDELAGKLGISTSAFYGYITRREIPQRSYSRLVEMLEGKFKSESNVAVQDNLAKVQLSSVSMDELVNEMEKRGWIVELKRKPL